MKESNCTLQIDIGIIRENYATLRNASTAEVSTVVKSNAYGLGVEQIAPVLKKDGCRHFFVASCDEGVELRKILGNGVNIYVLKGIFKSELSSFLEHTLIPVLNHISQVEIWQDYAVSLNKKLPCILHFDTGMHRLGMPSEEIEALSIQADMYKLDILYIMSHLISAEDNSSALNHTQLESFKIAELEYRQWTSKFNEANLKIRELGAQVEDSDIIINAGKSDIKW